MLAEAGENVETAIAEMFTDLLRGRACISQYWKCLKIPVLFKKGDAKMPENYRPIYIIPIIYKLFSKIVLNRIYETLIAAQSCDQVGFRPGYNL